MSLLNQVTEDDLTAGEIFFNKNEVVKFACVNAREDAEKGHIYIDCKILSGQHEGENYTVKVYASEKPQGRKNMADFVINSGFWTKAEWKHKTKK